MRLPLLARSLFATAGLVLWGCPAAAPVAVGPAPLISANPNIAPPNTVAPDDPIIAVARAGVDAASLLGPAVAAYQPLLAQIRAMRVKHPPAATYRLAQVDGWTYLAGWWTQRADDKRTLRMTLEDAAGKPSGWDVGRDDNYAPDLHAAFPKELARVHMEIDQVLPTGGRATFSFASPLGESGEAVDAIGTGSIAASGAAGSMSVEALSARIGGDGAVERGDVVIRSLGITTIQFTGAWDRGGLSGTATLMQSARKAADVYRDAGGRLLLKNDSGVYGL